MGGLSGVKLRSRAELDRGLRPVLNQKPLLLMGVREEIAAVATEFVPNSHPTVGSN